MDIYLIYVEVSKNLNFRERINLARCSKSLANNYQLSKNHFYYSIEMKGYKGVTVELAEDLFIELYKNKMKISYERMRRRPVYFCKFLEENGAFGRYYDLLLSIQDRDHEKVKWILKQDMPRHTYCQAKSYSKHFNMQSYF